MTILRQWTHRLEADETGLLAGRGTATNYITAHAFTRELFHTLVSVNFVVELDDGDSLSLSLSLTLSFCMPLYYLSISLLVVHDNDGNCLFHLRTRSCWVKS